jgi:hypothetical protein
MNRSRSFSNHVIINHWNAREKACFLEFSPIADDHGTCETAMDDNQHWQGTLSVNELDM